MYHLTHPFIYMQYSYITDIKETLMYNLQTLEVSNNVRILLCVLCMVLSTIYMCMMLTYYK